jgi:hypothetical protein
MLRADDIADAVRSGLISEGQARGLEHLAVTRRKTRMFSVGREERFKLLGGFNDFFIAIGVILLGVAILSAYRSMPTLGVGLIGFWGLAEYLTGRHKLVAPSIVIVVFLTWFAFSLVTPFAGTVGGGVSQTLTLAMPVVLVALHYWRFRLPFSLFVLALCGVSLALAVWSAIAVQSLGWTSEDANRSLKWLALILGLVTFAWAMSFDVADPERTSRRADCGFWLHLLAAPLIVHPLAGPLINHPFFPDHSKLSPVVTTGTVLAVLTLVMALSVAALIVDRRALLVAGLGYLGSALAYTMSQVAGVSASAVVVPTLVFLGVLIIVLGVGWRQIRSVVMTAVPGGPWKTSLPPYGQSA